MHPYGALALRENYGALALRRPNYGQNDAGNGDLEAMQAELEIIAREVEVAAVEAGETVSTAVGKARTYAEHRQFLYMVGAPAIVLAGLSNKKYPLLGLFAAAVGAFIGVKNYQEAEATGSLESYGQYPILQFEGTAASPIPVAADPWTTPPPPGTPAFARWRGRKMQTDPTYYGR
jgi:hypothetical protein